MYLPFCIDFAVLAAICKVDNNTKYHPDNEAHPCVETQIYHHIAVYQNTQDRHHRHQRRFKRTVQRRVSTPEHNYTCAYNHKSQQRAYTYQFPGKPMGKMPAIIAATTPVRMVVT